MEMAIIKGGEEEEERVVDQTETKIGRMPIMVGSDKCNIAGFTDDELIDIGEDPADPGGYFCVNGSERVLMTSEDLAPNKILAEYDTKYGDEVQVAKTFSQRRGYRALVLCERTRDGILEVSFPSVSGSINFVTLVRALGLESDEEIVHRVSDDPEIVKFMLENLEAADVQTTEEAIETLGKRVASGQGKNYQLKRANYVIDRYLLPHLHEDGVEEEDVRINKAFYLCRMAEACFELRAQPPRVRRQGPLRQQAPQGQRRPDARPVPDGAEQAGPGREVPNSNARTCEIGSSPSPRWFAPDVLTERLEHPIATGNWVGGRSGVSSSSTGRTTWASSPICAGCARRCRAASPTSEARDLHATQWGRIDRRRPRGPNCGLVKNFAQAMELSQNIEDDQELKQELAEMGVSGIPGIDRIEQQPADD